MHFRAASSEDYPTIVAIHNACWPEHLRDVETFQRFDAKMPTQRFVTQINSDVVGHGFVRTRGERYELEVAVLPTWRRQGIGAALYDQLMARVVQLPARPLLAFTKEIHLSFAKKRGWAEAMRSYHQHLELPHFDPTPFMGLLEALEQKGYSFHTFNQLPQTEREAKAHALVQATEVDIPATAPIQPIDLEGFRHKFTHNPNFIPEAGFIALKDGEYVGLTFTRKRSATSLHTGMMGVLETHRGQGLAMALKVRVAMVAKAMGMLELHTNNAATNVGILAVNERLGFVRAPAQIELNKEFT